MANLTTYKKNIIQHILDVLDAAGLGYQNTEFYGTATPETLIEYIKGRLNTGSGSVFVRVNRIERTIVDTVGEMYEARVILDVMVASMTASREDQQPRAERMTDQMLIEVSDALVASNVQLDGVSYPVYLGNEQDLFRDAGAGGLDVQLLNVSVDGLVIEY